MEQIHALHTELEKDSVFARRLHVDVAYHSSHMEAIADAYLADIGELREGQNHVNMPDMVSSVTGASIRGEELRTASYWVRNMVSPVNFAGALANVCKLQHRLQRKKLDGSHKINIPVNHLLEIGPHAALQGPIRDLLESKGLSHSITYGSTLSRNRSAQETLLHAMGQLHCLGFPVNLDRVNRITSPTLRPLSHLPEYQFNHSKTYWHEPRASHKYRFGLPPKLDLLGRQVANWNPVHGRWCHFIRPEGVPWVEDHKVRPL